MSNFQPLPTKLVFACFDRSSCEYSHYLIVSWTWVIFHEKRVAWFLNWNRGYRSQHTPPWKPWSDLSMPKRADSTQSYSNNANSVTPRRMPEKTRMWPIFNSLLIWKLCPAWKLSRVWIVTAQTYLGQIKTARDIFDYLIQQWQSTSRDEVKWNAMT